jgi:ABC-type Na+ transport system ATPase subunit NatA
VSHAYGARIALDEVSFDVAPGSFTVLLGLNGAGKSTLFSVITHLYASRSGLVRIFGRRRAKSGAALALLGVVFQQRTLDPDLSVAQNLAYHGALHGMGRAKRARVRSANSRVGLADRSATRCAISPAARCGGSKSRARSCTGRVMLLLDEPTAGLDIKARADILKIVRGNSSPTKASASSGRPISSTRFATTTMSSCCTRAGARDGAVASRRGKGAARSARRSLQLTGAGRPKEANGERAVLDERAAVRLDAAPDLPQRHRMAREPALSSPARALHLRAGAAAGLAVHLRGGFRQTLGVSIMPPYDTYVLYEVYITPGLMAMIQLFNGMQSSLSMVYDREMGSMRMLLVSPAPRWFLLTSKLIAGVAVSILQVYAFLVVAYFWEIEPPTWWGYLTVLPALALSGLMLGALGMLLSSLIKQLENFAGVMNFVIFPMFFASSALYPLWRVQRGKPVACDRLPAQSHSRMRLN